MQESDFQALYLRYFDAPPDSQIRSGIVKELHHYVYQYAIRRFGADYDMASNFYMKMYDRIENFFHEYDPRYKISFTVYLAVTLKRNYLKFLSSTKQKEDIYSNDLSWNSEISWDPPDHTQTAKEEAENKLDTQAIVLEAICSLALNQQIVLRLYFGFYLLLSHLRELLRRHQGLSFFPLYRKYVHQVKTQRTEEIFQRKVALEKMQRSLYRAQKETDGPKSRKRRESLIEGFYKVKPLASLSLISQLVKKSTSQVHRLINSAKKELKDIFCSKYREIPRALGINQ